MRVIDFVHQYYTPEQFNRIADWNKKRNGLELDNHLEITMLAEEVKEYYDAEDLVDKIDAVCDALFVAGGTITKAANGFHVTNQFIYEPIEVIIADITGRLLNAGVNLADITELLRDCLDCVIEANEQKGTEKDENGKVIKPEGFIIPEDRIEDVLYEFIKNNNNSNIGDVAAIFEDGK